jgi:hypothetical protein
MKSELERENNGLNYAKILLPVHLLQMYDKYYNQHRYRVEEVELHILDDCPHDIAYN